MYRGNIIIDNEQWQTNIATTSQELSQGLGNLESIPEHYSMLFDLGYPRYVSVTTQPMLFPIDIAFISGDFIVTQIERDVQPGLLIASNEPARAWLETNSDELADIEVGDGIIIDVLSAPVLPVSPLTYILPIVALGVVGAVGIGLVKVLEPKASFTALIPTSRVPVVTQEYPYERKVRIALRKLPAWKLQEIYRNLNMGESTGIPLLEEDRGTAVKVIREVLWERGKLTQVARVVTVPGGSHWVCKKCGKELKSGEQAVKVGQYMYCVECVKKPQVLSQFGLGDLESLKRVVDLGDWAKDRYYGDTEDVIEKKSLMFQTELDSAFMTAIGKVNRR